MSTTTPLTWPLGLVTPGHSGLPGSNSGLSSSWLFSTWPDHGLFMRCGETSTQSPRRGLYLHTGEVTSTLATTVCTSAYHEVRAATRHYANQPARPL